MLPSSSARLTPIGAICSRGGIPTGSPNIYDAAFRMYEVIKEGGFTNGGLDFDAKARRNTVEDVLLTYIAGMVAFGFL